jgi:hypothetical protein
MSKPTYSTEGNHAQQKEMEIRRWFPQFFAFGSRQSRWEFSVPDRQGMNWDGR